MMTLQQIYTLADRNARSVKVFESAAEYAEKAVAVSRSSYLPNIDFSASASYTGNPATADRNFSGWMVGTTPHFGNSFALEVSQVVFAGGAISNSIKASELKREIARWNLAAHKQDLYLLLTGYYLDLYKYRNLLGVYDANIRQTRQVIADMKAREEAGIVLPNDITRYEVQLQNLSYSRTQVLSSIEIANHRLITLVGLPEATVILPDTTLLAMEMPQKSETEALALAADAPSRKVAELGVAVSERNRRIVQADYYPHISVFAADNLSGPIRIEIPNINRNSNSWQFGVGLSYSLSSLFKGNKRVAQADAAILQSRRSFELVAEETELAVHDARVRYLESLELLRTQSESLRLAEDNYSVVSNRYLNGLVLITDLVDADNLRLSAQVQYVNAQINIVYNHYKILYAAGAINR